MNQTQPRNKARLLDELLFASEYRLWTFQSSLKSELCSPNGCSCIRKQKFLWWSIGRLGIATTLIALLFTNAFAEDKPDEKPQSKPLKIFILAGQSNMQGQACVRTIERLSLTEDSKQMYLDMKVKDGLPSAVENTYGVYFTSGDLKKGEERPLNVRSGPFQPGYGEELTPETTFGPDYAFGIYMQKHIQGPVLIIKTAWGGRSLLQQFRSPSAGPFEKEKDGHGNQTGYYYSMIVKHVKDVLADPGKFYPGYDKKTGCELVGFFWFQGYNDLIDDYYKKNQVPEKNLYSQYTDCLTALIRDLRKDLNAPSMPVVIGAIGIGGPIEDTKDSQYWLRKAQLAAADLPEFKGNVAAVSTEHFWDMEWERISNKVNEEAKKKALARDPNMSKKALSDELKKSMKTMAAEVLTPEELKIFQTATSNQAYHYMGSAYTYSKIGKAMAEALIQLDAVKK